MWGKDIFGDISQISLAIVWPSQYQPNGTSTAVVGPLTPKWNYWHEQGCWWNIPRPCPWWCKRSLYFGSIQIQMKNTNALTVPIPVPCLGLCTFCQCQIPCPWTCLGPWSISIHKLFILLPKLRPIPMPWFIYHCVAVDVRGWAGYRC